MIETTGDPRGLLTGWLRKYADEMAGTRFPASFQALCGVFALSTLVGRKAVIRRAGFRMFPPTSIILLGHSGVGKSKSLNHARTILEIAGRERKAFVVQQASFFTPAGLMKSWEAEQEAAETATLEGAVLVGEASAILTQRTGNETIAQWIIDVLEHDDRAQDFTKSSGKRSVQGVTVAFALASTVDYLRRSVSADQFAGGFMHRFLVAHETHRPEIEERHPSPEAINDLAEEARMIWDEAPDEMEIDHLAGEKAKAIGSKGEREILDTALLSGFWNRIAAMSLKLAGVFALSEGRGRILLEDVERGEEFLRKLYPPLQALVREMYHGGDKMKLFRIADDLYFKGMAGVEREELWKRLPTVSLRQAQEMVQFMEDMGLLFWSRDGKRCFRLPEWRDSWEARKR